VTTADLISLIGVASIFRIGFLTEAAPFPAALIAAGLSAAARFAAKPNEQMNNATARATEEVFIER
jgi:hypothetical protein